MNKVVAVGRRKRAVARVFLAPGTGTFVINKRNFEDYFPSELLKMKVREPFNVTETGQGQFDVTVRVNGGGINGQAEAVRLALSRALIQTNEEFKPSLKKEGFTTRDSRKVERKKYGKKKARKSTQFSKR